MNRIQSQIHGIHADVRRWGSVLLMVSLVAGSISLVSLAQPSKPEAIFQVSLSDKAPKGTLKTATPSDSEMSKQATPSILGMSNQTIPLNLGQLLEQSGDISDEYIIVDWFRINLNGNTILDSNNWSISLREGQEIEPDSILQYQLRVYLYPRIGEIEDGDAVSWKLGHIDGLNLPEEFWEPMSLYGIEIGSAALQYTENGEVWLRTEFAEGVQRFDTITITYTYESGFLSVNEVTQVEFALPGYEQPVTGMLLPSEESDPSEEPTETSPEETTREQETTTQETSGQETSGQETSAQETSAQETSAQETTAQETSTQETTAQETSTQETKAQGTTDNHSNKGSGSSSDEGSYVAKKAVEETTVTVPDTIPETTGELETETQEPVKESARTPQETREKQTAAGNDKQGEADGEPEIKETATKLDEPSINIDIVLDNRTKQQVMPGEVITYRIVIHNESELPMKDIRIRDYLPEHTSFVSAEADGIYGILNGRQKITWKIDRIEPGEEKELHVQVGVFPCVPEGYQIKNCFYWEDNSNSSVNGMEDPANYMEFPEILIG